MDIAIEREYEGETAFRLARTEDGRDYYVVARTGRRQPDWYECTVVDAGFREAWGRELTWEEARRHTYYETVGAPTEDEAIEKLAARWATEPDPEWLEKECELDEDEE